VPAQTMRTNLERVAGALPPSAVLVSAAKGLELSSGLRMTEVIAAVLPGYAPACALCGPNLAEEIARGLLATTVVAGRPVATAVVQRALRSSRFRVYTHE